EVFPLMDALNFVIESSMYAEFTGRHAINRGLEGLRPQPRRSDMREDLFLQLLFLFDSRQRLGVRLRELFGNAGDHFRIFHPPDPYGMDVRKLSAFISCGFEHEPASAAARITPYARKPVPRPVPLVEIEEDAAPLPLAGERSQRSSRFNAEKAGRTV